MSNPKRFPFIERRNQKGEANVFPCVPIALSHHDRTSEVFGLLDTGSSLNVLPYDVGLELGAVDVCFYRSQLALDICTKLRK